jgi:OPA family glycerol-3-phosphate transporter-like MFS transporter
MLGPYAFLSGAIALDLGSRKGSASAAGMIDAVGYFAGALAGAPIAKIAKGWGWSGAFTTLAATVVVVTIAAAMYWRSERRKDRAAGTA